MTSTSLCRAVFAVAVVAVAAARAEPTPPTPLLRYVLSDGNVVIGSLSSEDASALSVITEAGLLKIPKASLVSIELASVPPRPAPQPPPPGVTAPPDATAASRDAAARTDLAGKAIGAGLGVFAISWLVTGTVASIVNATGRPGALLGFTPIAGPFFIADGRSLGFATLGALTQAGGLVAAGLGIAYLSRRPEPPRLAFGYSPREGGGQLLLGGRF